MLLSKFPVEPAFEKCVRQGDKSRASSGAKVYLETVYIQIMLS